MRSIQTVKQQPMQTGIAQAMISASTLVNLNLSPTHRGIAFVNRLKGSRLIILIKQCLFILENISNLINKQKLKLRAGRNLFIIKIIIGRKVQKSTTSSLFSRILISERQRKIEIQRKRVRCIKRMSKSVQCQCVNKYST